MDKKFVFRLSTLALLVLAACAPAVETAAPPTVTREAKPPSTAAPTSAPVSALGVDAESLRGVVIMAWHPWFGPEASLFETQVADFNSTNEWGVTVLTQGQSNYAEAFNNVTNSLGTTGQPDVTIGLPEEAWFWDERNGVTDLTPYVNDPVWGLSAEEQADFSPVFWAQDQMGEKRLGMPAERTARLMFYNQTWARELGFSAPPADAEDFRKQACAANASFRANADPKDDAYGGWLVDTAPMTALSWLTAFGGGALEGEGYRFLRPENVEALKFVKALFDDNCAYQLAEADPIDEFANRRALFVTGGLENVAAQTRAFLDLSRNDEWTLIPFPGDGQPTMSVYGSSYIVLRSDETRQLAAWLFVRWMLSPDRQARWVQTTGMFPLRSLTLNLVADYATAHPQWVGAVKALPSAQGTPRYASWRLIRLVLGDGFNYTFRFNVPAGETAGILADMDRTVQDLVK